MSPHFPSRDELSAMDLDHLRALPVQDMEDEKLLQEIIDSKMINRPLEQKAYNLDAMSAVIETPEQEAEWQKIIDERNAEIRKRTFGEEVVLNEQIEKIEEQQLVIEEELKEEVKENIENLTVGNGDVILDDEGLHIDNKSSVKCELCGTKGFRHKKGCPTLVKE